MIALSSFVQVSETKGFDNSNILCLNQMKLKRIEEKKKNLLALKSIGQSLQKIEFCLLELRMVTLFSLA